MLSVKPDLISVKMSTTKLKLKLMLKRKLKIKLIRLQDLLSERKQIWKLRELNLHIPKRKLPSKRTQRMKPKMQRRDLKNLRKEPRLL